MVKSFLVFVPPLLLSAIAPAMDAINTAANSKTRDKLSICEYFMMKNKLVSGCKVTIYSTHNQIFHHFNIPQIFMYVFD